MVVTTSTAVATSSSSAVPTVANAAPRLSSARMVVATSTAVATSSSSAVPTATNAGPRKDAMMHKPILDDRKKEFRGLTIHKNGAISSSKIDDIDLWEMWKTSQSISNLGSIDNKVLEAAKRLHFKEHTVLDGSGNVFKLAAPVECKGIVGSDDRHYLLDLMRVTPRDANYTGPGSRFCILRPELITAFCQAQAAERSKCKSEGDAHVTTDSSTVVGVDEQNITKEGRDENVKDCASPLAETEPRDEILFNPNVFTEFKLSGNQEASLDLEIVEDEENVRKVSSYLTNVVLAKFVQDVCTLEVSPMDGQTLTEALHAHGINVRYIGKVADGTKHLPHLWDLCSNEIVVRSAKHILKDVLRDIEDHDIAGAISHFFNCFFGTFQAVGTKVTANNMQSRTHRKLTVEAISSLSLWTKEVINLQESLLGGKEGGKAGHSARKNQSSFMNVSSETLWWSDIQEFAKLKYQIELPEDARSRVKKVSVIRNLCQKVGISVAARKYDLNSAAPFQTSDILNLQPVVKHSVPLCSEAKDLVETGKIQLAEGMLSEAYTLFSEAFSILQQVTGPMHREVANCCRYLAMVLYHAGDMAGAIMQQHKELIINERYGNMALFYHGLNQTELALRHMSRALLLLSLSSGPDHPDVAATFINVAMMYQDIGKMNTALRYLQEALKKNERLLGEEHIQTAVCYHALAIAFNCMGAFKLSHQHEKKTYDILVKQLGEEDSRTRDSQNWMKTFKMRELQMNAQKQKGQALNAASAQKAIDILKAHPDLIHAFQAAAAAGGSGSSGTSVNKSLNAAVIGENLPRGRGVDERAARAAAEVRKKAAARGLLIRPHGVPVQALPPLTQLLNIINSGMTPDAAEGGETDGVKTEANGHPSDGPVDSKDDQLTSGQEDQAPVGLGTGLASLDAKKQKAKAKVAA
uniref:Clu domain-containing protein n=1 Tax=Fagus sylvatica TaxID=28930 RepID=A0A2N9FQD6_FAGSY